MTDPFGQDAAFGDSSTDALVSIDPVSAQSDAITAGESARSPVVVAVRDRFTWLVSCMAFLAVLSFVLPYTVEQMTYSFARGRQRALYDTAGEQLNNVVLKDVSDACQLVANRVGPSVVQITSTQMEAAKASEKKRGWKHPATSQGSGVIVDEQGFIVTNQHVIQGCTDIYVKLSDGRRLSATVIGKDSPTDIAILKVHGSGLLAADWGDSDVLEVGGLVWALGSPLGLQHSVTFGILSGKNRSFSARQRQSILDDQGIDVESPYHNFLQTDAAVNPGNSGGPLVDSQGCVVGINTAIVGEAYQGISFAIPSSIARPVYERIRAEGHVTRGWLGVKPDDLTPEMAQQLQLPDARGALIVAVVANPDGSHSPAQQAGILAGDVIVRWNGREIGNSGDLFSAVALTDVGSSVEAVMMRDGRQLVTQVTVVPRPYRQ